MLTSLAANNITCKNANVTKTVLGLDWIATGKLNDYVLGSGIDPKMLTTKTSEVMYMDNGNMFLAGMTASDEIERTLQMTAWRGVNSSRGTAISSSPKFRKSRSTVTTPT